MKKGLRSSLFAIVAIVLVLSTVLAGCGKNADDSGKSDDDKQVFRMNLSAEPPSLDPGIAQDQTSFTVLKAIYEGLTRQNGKGETEPAVAKSWDISEDGKTYTFHLRDVKWSNGDPVKASDFEFAWKRALDPATASPYAYQLYYIKNAQAYNEKKITDASQVGVKAQDDKTLVVELNSATPYFLSLVGFITYMPLNEKSVKDNAKWASEADSMITNGAFKMTEWKHNDHITLVKNKNYFNAKQIKLSEVHLSMVKDAGTELSMYKTDQLDWAGRPTGEIPTDQIPSLKDDKNANLQIKGIASTYFYDFNTTKAPFDNLKIRKAFAMSIDRKELVDKVTLGNQQPAYGFVPPGIMGVSKEFREEYPDDYFKEDYEQAKQFLAEGMEEKGLKKFPTVTLIHNEGDAHKKVAAALADMWRKNLGVEVKVESQEWGVLINNRNNKNYELARDGWGADYNDAMTFIDLWTSTSGNNNTGINSKEYDDLVKTAYSTSDQKERVEAMAKAEKLFMNEMPIAPLYYYTSIWLQKKYVKDVYINYSGDIDFTRAYIKK